MDILTREKSRRLKVSKALSHSLSRSFIPDSPEPEECKWLETPKLTAGAWTVPVLTLVASLLLIFNLCRTRRSTVAVSRIECEQSMFEKTEDDDGHGQSRTPPPLPPPASPYRARDPSIRPELKIHSSDRDMAVLMNWIDRQGAEFGSFMEQIERELG